MIKGWKLQRKKNVNKYLPGTKTEKMSCVSPLSTSVIERELADFLIPGTLIWDFGKGIISQDDNK